MQRREFIAGLGGAATCTRVARAQPASPGRARGPLVWLDMGQKELDEAYDQRVYAPNMQQVIARCEHVGDLMRERIGEPKRLAYGPSAIEGLDLYATKAANAPVNVYVHGEAWRAGSAKGSAHHAEMLVNAGAHVAVLDFNNVLETTGPARARRRSQSCKVVMGAGGPSTTSDLADG
jgi:arylformamidase